MRELREEFGRGENKIEGEREEERAARVGLSEIPSEGNRTSDFTFF